MPHGKITKKAVAQLAKGQTLIDTEQKGFVARRLQSDTVTYGYRFWSKGKQHWRSIGLHGRITPDQARKQAMIFAGEVAAGRNPAAERAAEIAQRKAGNVTTVNSLLDLYIKHDVEARGLSSVDEIKRIFDVYVRPRIGKKNVQDLDRDGISRLQDAVAEEHGPVMSDRMFAWLSRALRWYQKKNQKYAAPVVPGMQRIKPGDRINKRFLDDQEIRDVWAALDSAKVPKCFPRYIRALLLSGQRRTEQSHPIWEEVKLDQNVWVIPIKGQPNSKRRGKSGNVVPMTPALWELFGKPRKEGFIFSNDGGKRGFSGYSKAKAALKQEINRVRKEQGRPEMPRWRLHDLRHTATTLLNRIGVDAEIADRVTAHKQQGQRKVYNHWDFLDEKRDALEKLAVAIDDILAHRDPAERKRAARQR